MQKIPSRPFKPAGVFSCSPRDIPLLVHQAHVIKHPFGLHALMEQRGRNLGARHWNAEAWDATSPPVITNEQRRIATAAISALSVDGQGCQVPRLSNEEYAGEVGDDWEGCYRCSEPVAQRCTTITRDIAAAYRQVIDLTLELIDGAEGRIVPRAKLSSIIWKSARVPARLDGLTVMTIGWHRTADRSRPMIRISRWDGIRSEFLLESNELRWRTTYRQPPRSAGALLTFLMDYAETPVLSLRLSDSAIVPRRWSEESGAWS